MKFVDDDDDDDDESRCCSFLTFVGEIAMYHDVLGQRDI